MLEINEMSYEEVLSTRFNNFLAATTQDMKGALSRLNGENLNKLQEEQARMQGIINNKKKAAEDLAAKIAHLRKEKQNRTLRLYSVFQRDEDKRKLKIMLNVWIGFHLKKAKQKKMELYVSNFYERGLMMRNYKGWKDLTQNVHKANVNQATMKKIENEVANAKDQAFEEIELLRTMVKELTEDLRNETIAKNSLKYKFEQALLRGMSALNLENMNIHQEVISQARAMTETSRSLLYTPDKLGYLTRS